MMDTICTSCGRKCRARRNEYEGTGFCKSSINPRIALVKVHRGEEPPISGTNGSGTVFFSNCSLRCAFCQNYSISHEGYGITVTPKRLAEIFADLEAQKVHNINLVNPTHYIDSIIAALQIYKPDIPIVYNTSAYDDIETLKKAARYIDIYLPDFKLFDAKRCARYLNAPNYFDVASKAIKEMLTLQPHNVFDDNGIMLKGVIIRHLLLPCNVDQTKKVLGYIRESYGDVLVSLMTQYYPAGIVSDMYLPEINRATTLHERKEVSDYYFSLGFTNGYTQTIKVGNNTMTPVFDGSGVLKNNNI